MEKIILFLLAGMAVGIWIKMPPKLEKAIGHLQTIGVILLLFAMGIGIGANPDLLSQLSDIGIHSLSMALLSIAGSTLFIYLLIKRFRIGGDK